MQIRTLLCLCIIGLSLDAAAQQARPIYGERCISPQVSIDAPEAHYPGAQVIKNTTNLRRKTGIALTATGDRMYFTGKIVDSNCVPVPEAVIEIWQADAVGRYSFPMNGMKISTDSNFIGTGRAVTDNEGNFSFLTIFPGNYANRAPHINYRITHPDFREVIGTAFFEYNAANEKDPVLAQYKRADQPPVIAQQITPGSQERMTDRNYFVKIVLKGQSTFHRF